MEIELKKCNNIDEGTVVLEEGKLNIKYAINGTGKSTIAHAIQSKVNGENLSFLKQFKNIDKTESEYNPEVNFSQDIKSVAIFNEEFINQHTYKKTELLDNSFEILVKTPKYEEHMENILRLTSEINDVFIFEPDLDVLIGTLEKFCQSFGKELKNGISKTSNLYKTMGAGNKLEKLSSDLEPYRPYLNMPGTNVNWIRWQAEGKSFLNISDKCPYCVSNITTPRETIEKVSEEFNAKYLTAISEIIDTFKALQDYFTDDTREKIDRIYKNATGFSDDHITFLRTLYSEANGLKEKLNSLKYLGFNSFKDVDKVVVELQNKRIDLTYYEHLNCSFTKEKIDKVNESIQKVIDTAGILQGEVAKQKELIKKTIEKHKDGINGFLNSAGYSYEVEIHNDENEEYRLILKYKDNGNEITEVKSHLSYGERNAFALVLFMYQALKENTDLIILDDPISSFDSNKKFAIMSMLFRGKDSFAGKTVLMLTHDFEPIIDMVATLSSMFGGMTRASFLANNNGRLSEKSINRADIKSFISICKDNITNSSNVLHKLIYYRRLLEVTEKKELEWDLISNVFHKHRETPLDKDNNPMLEEQINTATDAIKVNIPEFQYDTVYALTKDITQMKEIYAACSSGYEKVQIFRIVTDGNLERGSALKKYVDETFHIQNDYLFQLNPREYELVPQYILDYCDEEMDKL